MSEPKVNFASHDTCHACWMPRAAAPPFRENAKNQKQTTLRATTLKIKEAAAEEQESAPTLKRAAKTRTAEKKAAAEKDVQGKAQSPSPAALTPQRGSQGSVAKDNGESQQSDQAKVSLTPMPGGSPPQASTDAKDETTPPPAKENGSRAR